MQKNTGFSVVNLLVGITIASVVAMTSAYIVVQTKQKEVGGESFYSLNQEYILALQKLKSVATLKASIGISSGSPLANCFAGRGTNCQSFQISDWTAIPGFATSSTVPGNRTVASTGSYKISCGAPSSCDSLLVRVQSQLSKGSETLYARQSEDRIGGVFLTDRGKIDFTCASTNLMTALNMRSLVGECTPLPTANPCPSQRALMRYRIGQNPDCQPIVSSTCANGFKAVGILGGQGACW